VPKGGRYINVVRNPGDVLVSNFKFMEGWFIEPGAIGIEEFARETFLKKPEYFDHLKSWWPRRHDPDVLFMAYELNLADSAAAIAQIAGFIGVPLDDELLELTLKHSSIDFMLQHKDRFDDVLMRELSERDGALPKGSDSAKVREGKAGSAKSLPPDLQAAVNQMWVDEAAEFTGCATYDELLGTLRQELAGA